MPKRFADTELWTKEWFMNLSPGEKCAFQYLASRCDNVGVWSPNYKLAEFVIGSEIDWSNLPNKMNSNVVILPSGKWWLPDFCSFQYGELTPECRPHKTYIDLLKKHGLYDEYLKGINRVSVPLAKGTLRDKEKEKEKELDKDKEKDKDYIPLAERLLALHLEIDPGFCDKKRANGFIQNASKSFRLLIETDGRNLKEVKALLEWCKADDFWCSVIQSGSGFRKNYDKMLPQYQRAAREEEDEIAAMKKKGFTFEEDIEI
jgi:hypothetical protein